MKCNVLAIVLTLAVAATGLNAQETPKASLHVFSDQFGGNYGAVFYPQYVWNAKMPTGTIGGYGFGEVAPYEAFFTNHLVVYTPRMAPGFLSTPRSAARPTRERTSSRSDRASTW